MVVKPPGERAERVDAVLALEQASVLEGTHTSSAEGGISTLPYTSCSTVDGALLQRKRNISASQSSDAVLLIPTGIDADVHASYSCPPHRKRKRRDK